MIFAVTERGTFKRCQRRAVLTSKNGRYLTNVISPLALNVGTIVHRTLQLWTVNPNTPVTDCAMQAGDEIVVKVINDYRQAVGTNPSFDELGDVYTSIGFAQTMCENYARHWKVPLPQEYTLLSTEQKISVPVPGTEHKCEACNSSAAGMTDQEYATRSYVPVCGVCNGTGTALHILEGRLDGLLQHASGRVDILERKTYGQRPKQADLQSNDQFLAYAWLLKKLRIAPVSYVPCVVYDGLWRRDHVPLRRKFDDLLCRFTITRSLHEIEEFERFLPIELNDMARLYAQPENAYINRDWRGCWDCPFEDKDSKLGVCRAMSRGEDHEAIIKNNFTTRTDEDVEDAANDPI